jgi:hypothetical protein
MTRNGILPVNGQGKVSAMKSGSKMLPLYAI